MASARHEVDPMSTRQPSWFIPHGGGPCFFMDWSPIGPADTWNGMEGFLRGLLDGAPQPRAVLVISAHWEAPAFTVNTAAQPALLFDYHGFPEHTYRLRYPARGDPALATRVQRLIAEAGLPASSIDDRGLDHGVFVPMLLIDPPAAIPVVQLSLREGLDPAEHIRLGRVLAPLRDDGVLILGSGMSYHDVRALMRGNSAQDAQTFDDWLTAAVIDTPERRDAALIDWAGAPSARAAHPREEHLLPLMVAAGAAGDDRGARVYSEPIMGNRVSAYRFGA
jgi:aromatic ring-opening dioxygenase catalytic subunit (LigB family)